MSVVVFTGEEIPERHLELIKKYKAFLSEDQKEEIIDQISQDLKNIDDYQINMHVVIELKKYKK